MKTLFIVRHAKAKKESETTDDFERPLNRRGRKEAAQSGHRLLSAGLIPQLILSSAAFRTLSTARIIAEQIAYPADLIITDMQLFEADTEKWLHVIGDTADEMNSLMIIGHNPAIETLFNLLADLERDEFPTSGIAVLQFQTGSWRILKPRSGRLVHFIQPEK